MSVDPLSCASVGEALDRAMTCWASETCVIESDRERERARLTFAELRRRALALAAWLAERGFDAGDRAAIVMTNQSKWHVAAFAVLRSGGVLVPLDFKLRAEDLLVLLAHCRPRVLVVEHPFWRALVAADGFDRLGVEIVLVTEAPGEDDLPSPRGGREVRWERVGCESPGASPAGASPSGASPPLAPRRRDDEACIVYSSGTGGRVKGCRLTNGNYLSQLDALIRLHPFRPGVHYLSILPTNHAIDFTVGFLGPYLCGATVVHLRTLRPEIVREAFRRYGITHVALVPMVLSTLEGGLRERFAQLSPARRGLLSAGKAIHRVFGGGRPCPSIARCVLRPVHAAFGGRLEAIFVGGARTEPGTLRFFHELGIPVANGYGLTEAGTAVTLDRLDPPRPDTVGVALPGVEIRIRDADANSNGVGEVCVRGPTVMAGYLDDPELTAETIVDGWLRTGDLGRLDTDGALHLVGRRKNMIVTAGGKNVYPEDVESAFADIGVKELCVFAAHALWPPEQRPSAADGEQLVLVVRLETGDVSDEGAHDVQERIVAANRRLRDFQRVSGTVLWSEDFPRTASLKVKREELAERIADRCDARRDVIRIP